MKPPIASEMVKGVFCSWDCALDDSGVRMFLNGHLSLQGLCFLLLSIVVGGQALEVRLKGGRHRCEGRVEMKHQGTWGMVYFEYWFLDAAEIVCGHLKCGHAVDAPRGVYFGPTVGPIWTFSLQCNNTEAGVTFNLNDCTAAEVKNYDHIMSHDQDIGAVCSGNQTQVLPQCHDSVSEPGGSAASEGSPANCSDSRRLRLADGGGRCAGRVEILHQGSWGTICDDGWDLTDAHVVCRQLGCGQAVDASPLARFGAGSGPIWLDELNCTGKEPHVWRCPSRGWGRHDCRHKEDAGVVCSEFLALRMVSEDQECAGWLEVFYNGTWGSVCRSRMDEITLSIEEKPELSNCGPLPDKEKLRLREEAPSAQGAWRFGHSGSWGTVCDDSWSLAEAEVVRGQLCPPLQQVRCHGPWAGRTFRFLGPVLWSLPESASSGEDDPEEPLAGGEEAGHFPWKTPSP
ncbi:Antigen WC1.1 [Camelus dromedarius]|nr:Antigen WC1.1 [Camelus dromedarius]KAB1254390.1 Antigen WC1.1 [Camelus dromedarius]